MNTVKRVILLICCSISYLAQAEQQLFVEIRATKIRQAPKIWSPGIAEVRYGEKLTNIQEISDWFKVATPSGVEGYVHKTAVTNRKVLLEGEIGQVSAEADPADIVLAGKGFSKEIEQQYFGDDQSLDYLAVDMLEALVIDHEQLIQFIKEGHLADNE